jgi:hypothetical protein
VACRHAPLKQQLLDISETQREPMVDLDKMGDDHLQKAVTLPYATRPSTCGLKLAKNSEYL